MGGRGGAPRTNLAGNIAAATARAQAATATRMMKPREIFNAQPRRIRIDGKWSELGTISLIGAKEWTIRDTAGNVLARVSGNTQLEVEA